MLRLSPFAILSLTMSAGVASAHFVGEEEATLRGGSTDGSAGESVSMDASGTRVVVGEPRADAPSFGLARGELSVWVRSGRSWSLEQRLGVTGAGHALLGTSVAIDASGTRVAAGAIGGDGVVYVFARSGATWSVETILAPPVAGIRGRFGASVAMDGAGSRLLIGSPWSEEVFVFDRMGASWSRSATLTVSAPSTARLGEAVALAPDGSRAALGAPLRRAVYVFAWDGSAWGLEQELRPAPFRSDLGASVAIDDSATRLIAGAPGSNEALVFVRAGTTWTREETLSHTGGEFGDAVAIDATGSHVVVGAPTATSINGRAFAFVRSAGVWAPDGETRGGTGFSQEYGRSADMAGDATRIVLGAPVMGTGRAVVYPRVGETCIDGSTCITGHCVDGVCCDRPCGDVCASCVSSETRSIDGHCNPYRGAIARTLVCRAAAGVCDAEETCSDLQEVCPRDRALAAGTVCRAADGDCDEPERCDGTAFECPADALLPAGVLCRSGTGACDPQETCDGVSAGCPPDALASGGTVCRAATGAPCDVAEVCDGAGVACPEDLPMCMDAGAPDGGLVDAGPASDAGTASDAGLAADGSVSSDAGAALDAGSDAAAPALDAGPPTDAGEVVPDSAGCSCRAAPRGLRPSPWLALLVLVGWRGWRGKRRKASCPAGLGM